MCGGGGRVCLQVGERPRGRWCVCLDEELVIDFRKLKGEPEPSVIHGEEVQLVDTYKYLGTVFDNRLKFHANTNYQKNKGFNASALQGDRKSVV